MTKRGNYRLKFTLKERLEAKTKKAGRDQCWLFTGSVDKKGYGQITERRPGFRKAWKAHRLAYIFACGKIPKGEFICHTCDNPTCINPRHLYAGTAAENSADMVERKRQRGPAGVRNSKAKLNDDKIREIRKKYAVGGLFYKDLGKEYGVDSSTICDIINRRIWKHVTV